MQRSLLAASVALTVIAGATQTADAKSKTQIICNERGCFAEAGRDVRGAKQARPSRVSRHAAPIISADERFLHEPNAEPSPLVRAAHREARQAARQIRHVTGRALDLMRGLVSPLAVKVESIKSACPRTQVISGVRHTYVAGTRRISLHASGKAVDVRGNYPCIYRQLSGWSGGYSTDAGRVRHIHISYDADGRREWGARFRHGGGISRATRGGLSNETPAPLPLFLSPVPALWQRLACQC